MAGKGNNVSFFAFGPNQMKPTTTEVKAPSKGVLHVSRICAVVSLCVNVGRVQVDKMQTPTL